MGKRGPQPKPTALRMLHGDPGHQKKRPKEPTPPPGDVTTPARLEGRAAELWEEFVAILNPLGLYTKGDKHALVQLCKVSAEVEELEDYLDTHPTTYTTTHGGLSSVPQVAQLRDRRTHWLKLMDRFGLSPSSRTGLAPPPRPEESEFDQWRKKRKT